MILSAPTIYFRKNTLLSSENIIFALLLCNKYENK